MQTKQNPADKYVTPEQQREDVEATGKKNRMVRKEAVLELKELKNNMALLLPVRLFASDAKILGPDGQPMTKKEEAVFKVVMRGNITDDFHMKVEEGDLVMITNAAGMVHQGTTRVKIPSGEILDYYYMIALGDVMFKVDYGLLPPQ
jgi:hypothetical protein